MCVVCWYAMKKRTLGRSVKNQVRNWVFRSSSSVYQKPRVVDSHDICVVKMESFKEKTEEIECLYIYFHPFVWNSSIVHGI